MRKLSVISVIVAAFFILAGTAMAVTYSYPDNYTTWPGYDIMSSQDQIGSPAVGDMTITVDDNGYLESIAIDVTGRRYWDSLFINTTSASLDTYEEWDYYYITNEGADSRAPAAPATGLYAVGDPYEYILAPTAIGARDNHPAGIAAGDWLSDANDLFSSMNYDGSILTYNFVAGEIYLGDERTFTIGYSPWCANDVFLTPVPEPFTLLLLGIGLLGVGLVRKMS